MLARRFLIVLAVVLLTAAQLWATHYRAGEITYENVGYLSYRATVTTYTTDINTPPDSDTIRVYWGDGTSELFYRNGNGQVVGNDVKKNVYKAVGDQPHTYAGPLPFYVISVIDPARKANINNINGGQNTDKVAFYIEDTLRIYDPNLLGSNSSPVLLYPPIDYGAIDQVFYHNPLAYDPDGDSLTFEFVTPLQNTNFPVPNYVLPDQVQAGLNNDISMDINTGEIVWDAPQQMGDYNVAILITEYRNGVPIGTVLRDMQILVLAYSNQAPTITQLQDTCIVAGNLLNLSLSGSDPDNNQLLTMSADGGPFQLGFSPAEFFSTPSTGSVSGDFQWQTECEHIQKQPYQVVFRVSDDAMFSSQPAPLVALESWLIEVVGPPPLNPVAQELGNNIEVSWDAPYSCADIDKFIGFSVWRRIGSNPFVPGDCDIGLAGQGYTKLADGIQDYTFIDSTAEPGNTYCYRILAEFGDQSNAGLYYNRVESLPSEEVCEELAIDIPLITNVTVEATDDANGEILVRWMHPELSPDALDTTQFPGPYEYKVMYNSGFNMQSPVEVASFTANSFTGWADTVFVQNNINTATSPHAYRIDLYANGLFLGSSTPASSVYLDINTGDSALGLSWEANVPWQNTVYTVHKFNDLLGSYQPIASITDTFYVDNEVVNDSVYCYFIETEGAYTAQDLNSMILINLSQEKCGQPLDTIAPCAPVLTVTNPCSDGGNSSCEEEGTVGQNSLSWNHDLTDTCNIDTRNYNIYYQAPGGENFVLVDSVISATEKNYIHTPEGNTLSGCYVVTAVDSVGNESLFSNIDCVTNCPCYELPNAFSPNNDNRNDIYTPFKPYRYVTKIEMKIYDRWGALVYETTDPDINWDGRDINNGQVVKDGVYYYVCTVIDEGAEPSQQNNLVLDGYIHVFTGGGGQ